MIVNATPYGWEIIYHRAHALLAAQLAGQWRRKDAPARLYETLAAISHHDDLEKEWEEDSPAVALPTTLVRLEPCNTIINVPPDLAKRESKY